MREVLKFQNSLPTVKIFCLQIFLLIEKKKITKLTTKIVNFVIVRIFSVEKSCNFL